MSSCILCLKPTKRSKITLHELIIDKTVKEVIIEQFSNHELILTGSSSASQAICPTCCKHFKDFYNFKKDINQKLSEVAVKVEEVPVDFVNFVLIEEPVLDYDLKQLEINIERVKTEPKDVEEYLKEFKYATKEEKDDSDFEWKLLDEEDFALTDDKKPRSNKRKRKASDDDSDFDLKVEKSKIYRKVRKVTKLSFRSTPTPKDEEDNERIRKICGLKCHECDTPMDTYFNLRSHFHLKHPKVQAYLICCDRKFMRRNRLMNHINRHDKMKSITCEFCGKICMNKEALRAHIRFIHKGIKKPEKKILETFVCNECGKKCKGVSSFNRHMMMNHEEDEKGRTFECFKCHAVKKNQSLLKLHFKQFHNPFKETHKTCKICGKTLSFHSYPYHMKTHSKKPVERVKCSICDHWIRKKFMNTHLKTHEGFGISCEICGKFMSSKNTYVTHKRTVHSGPGKFECAFCDKKYVHDIKLIEHTAVVHTKEFPWNCRVRGCGRGFRHEAAWKTHEKEAHPEMYEKYFKPSFKREPNEPQPDLSQASFEIIEGWSHHSDPGVNCDVCGKYLRLTSWLQKHKNDFHTDSLPKFCCTLCDAKFNQQQDLEDHTESAHTKEIVVRCRVEGCGRGFSTRFSWKRHEMIVHPEEYAMMQNVL